MTRIVAIPAPLHYPTRMDLQNIGTLVAQLGLPVVLVMVFVWRDYKREEKTVQREQGLMDRLSMLEDSVRDEYQSLSKQAIVVMEQCAGAINHNTVSVSRLERLLEKMDPQTKA